MQAFAMVITLPTRSKAKLTFIPSDVFLTAAEDAAQKRHAADPAELDEFMDVLREKTPLFPVSGRQIHTLFKAALTEHMMKKQPDIVPNPIKIDARAAMMGFDVMGSYKGAQSIQATVISLFPRR